MSKPLQPQCVAIYHRGASGDFMLIWLRCLQEVPSPWGHLAGQLCTPEHERTLCSKHETE